MNSDARELLSRAGLLGATLSDTHKHFLEFVARNPGCLLRSQFTSLEQAGSLYQKPIQSWPTFVGSAKRAEMERVSIGLCSLIKSLPERLFGFNPDRLAAFYGIPLWVAQDVVRALRDTGVAGNVVARGDFIDTLQGFKCLEFNICGNVGGWQTSVWVERFRSVPLIESFKTSLLRRVSHRDTLREFLTHSLTCMQAREERLDGVFNLGVLAEPSFQGAKSLEMYLDQQYSWILRCYAPAGSGRVALCDYASLSARDGALWAGRTQLHGLVEMYNQPFSQEISSCFARGDASFFNGPLRSVLDDKRNLALLSQYQDARDMFDEEEMSLLRTVLPWTRQVSTAETLFNGERVYLPDFLLHKRENLVLKEAKSFAGKDVWFGRSTSPADWADLVGRALIAGGWIVQEFMESKPYIYQTDPSGCAPHDVVWGLFVFGSRYGGCFLRMQPRDQRALVNTAQGAKVGLVFEVEE